MRREYLASRITKIGQSEVDLAKWTMLLLVWFGIVILGDTLVRDVMEHMRM